MCLSFGLDDVVEKEYMTDRMFIGAKLATYDWQSLDLSYISKNLRNVASIGDSVSGILLIKEYSPLRSIRYYRP